MLLVSRYVNVIARLNDWWVSSFHSARSRKHFSSDSSARGGCGSVISLGFEGLGHRLGRIVKELDGAQHPNNEKPIPNGHNALEEEEEAHGKGPTENGTFELEIAHSMPQWIAFVDVLVEGDYLSGKRGDGVLLFEGKGTSKEREKGKDDEAILARGFANFASHRVDLLRHLSRRDIQLMVAPGCPRLNPKVITSSKRLRAYVHIDEGEVCSACHLRGSCSMAYVAPSKKETARMIDVLRLLFVFGYASQSHPFGGHSQRRSTKGPVCRLLNRLVELSKLPFDQDYKNSMAMVENYGWNDIEMKKGDWMCPKCEFMNFAKNKRCLRCGMPPPRKKLKPGEWECPGTCRGTKKVMQWRCTRLLKLFSMFQCG